MPLKKKKLLRTQNLSQAENEIIEIEDAGHQVQRFTDFHWRIDDKIDVWPTSKKYMKRDGFFNVKNYNKLGDIFL